MEREPAYAGQFYPGNPEPLRQTVQSFISRAESPIEARAVVVPHAGYIYSGAVTGSVLSKVKLPRRIILLGPNHTGLGEPLSLSPSRAWKTPLGSVSIDKEMNQGLLDHCSDLRENSDAHLKEHSLEVQIPFIQLLQPDSCISAICVGTTRYDVLESLGHAMAQVLQSLNEPVMLLSSSDMTHYESAESAASKDRLAIDRILEIDPPGLYRTIVENNISMCGFAPTVAVLTACRDMSASGGQLVEYTNSGEASGDYTQVVAYAGIVII
jgi:AmmeMemoRadiSam system protein B